MICTTIRNGQDCVFMSNKGCTYRNGACREIIETCHGCGRTIEFDSKKYCSAYPDPNAKWKNGNCNLATHIVTTTQEKEVKINPLKASKRAKKG